METNYSTRYARLNALFDLGKNVVVDENGIRILFYPFRSAPCNDTADNLFPENFEFLYPVFMPAKVEKAGNAILLLHGLNERNWSKYLPWAEKLCLQTGKPVILFPIAFHINRAPRNWSDPRAMSLILSLRRHLNQDDRSSTYANVALSERISENPLRFFNSGRQSLRDVTQLLLTIDKGEHPLFLKHTRPDIFSYSIGVFLSEIALMINPMGLFSDTKLFFFCGGGLFSSMYGESRSIMDKTAFDKMYGYYMNDFCEGMVSNNVDEKEFQSFNCMIAGERQKEFRTAFFRSIKNRLKGVLLRSDKVMPFEGVIDALGEECSAERVSVLDFPYSYTHENPFPVVKQEITREVDFEFERVFSEAARFLA